MRMTRMFAVLVAVAAVTVVGASAEAQLPKEGTVLWTYAFGGTIKPIPVGDTLFLAIFDDMGVVTDVTGDGAQAFNNASNRCFGTGHFVGGIGKWSGKCVTVDPAGDQLVFDFQSAEHQLGKPHSGKFSVLGGTGKFKGFQATGKYDNFVGLVKPVADGTYQGYSKVTMSYTLP